MRREFFTIIFLSTLCALAIPAAAQQNALPQPGMDVHQAAIPDACVADHVISIANSNSHPLGAGIQLNRFNGAAMSTGFSHLLQLPLGAGDLLGADIAPAPAASNAGAGYYIAATARPANALPAMTLLRVGCDGKIQWSFAHAANLPEEAVAVVTMPNGDAVLVGKIFNKGGVSLGSSFSVYAARFTPNGLMLWANTYSAANGSLDPNEATLDPTEGNTNLTGLGGIAITGAIEDTSVVADRRAFVMTIDGAGQEVWRNAYLSSGPNQPTIADEGFDLVHDPKSNTLNVAGRATGQSGNQIFYFQIQTDGTAISSKLYAPPGVASNTYARAIHLSQTTGNFLLAGPDFNSGGPGGTTFLMEIGNSGLGSLPIWARHFPATFAHPISPESIASTSAGYFLLTNTPGVGGSDLEIILTDPASGVFAASQCCPVVQATYNSVATGEMRAADRSQSADLLVQPIGLISSTIKLLDKPCAPILSVDADKVLCQSGACTNLSASVTGGSGIFTYKWSTGATTPTITVCPTVTTTYQVTITDANGCQLVDDVKVTVGTAPVAKILPATATVCPCTNTTLTASATSGTLPYTYKWSTGATTANISVSPSSTTTYTVSVTDAKGCVSIKSMTVTVRCLPPSALSTSIASGKVTFKWVKPNCPGNTELYQLQYRCGSTGLWTTVNLNGSVTAYTINLPTCSNRQWKMRARCCGGVYSAWTGTAYYLPTGYTGDPATDDAAFDDQPSEERTDDDYVRPFLSLRPNPASSLVRISLGDAPIDRIEIFDMQGRLVSTPPTFGSDEIQVNVSTFPTGVYFVKIRSGAAVLTEKLVKE